MLLLARERERTRANVVQLVLLPQLREKDSLREIHSWIVLVGGVLVGLRTLLLRTPPDALFHEFSKVFNEASFQQTSLLLWQSPVKASFHLEHRQYIIPLTRKSKS